MRLALAVVVMMVLAGCGDEPDEPQEIILESDDPAQVHEATSDDEAPTKQVPKSGQRGFLTGFVLDDTLRPIEGAVVRLPGLEDQFVTQDDGAFAFPDLWPGPYRVTAEAAGHRGADTVVDVVEDEFVQVKFVLDRVAPPEPRVETLVLKGYTDVALPSALQVTLWTGCDSCAWYFDLDPAGLQHVVVETQRDNQPVVADLGPEWSLSFQGMDSGKSIAFCNCENPARIEGNNTALGQDESFYVSARPLASDVPQFAIDFEVFVTAFYYHAPPEDWSFFEQ